MKTIEDFIGYVKELIEDSKPTEVTVISKSFVEIAMQRDITQAEFTEVIKTISEIYSVEGFAVQTIPTTATGDVLLVTTIRDIEEG